MVTKTETAPFDAADYLDTPEMIAAYLSAAFEENDPAFFASAFGDVLRSKGMTKMANSANVNREGLYRSFSKDGNPELATVMKFIGLLGLRLEVRAHGPAQQAEPA